MINIDVVSASEFPVLVNLWERSVRSTHSFLLEKDLHELRPMIAQNYLPNLNVRGARNSAGELVGFIGLSGKRIEMLFVDAMYIGHGIGKQLINYAIEQFDADELDVNEQNPQAVAFYKHIGFIVTGRSALDGQNKPYPLLHMKYAAV